MGKNKRRQIDFFDSLHNTQLKLDSVEEVDTLEWLIEAANEGIIDDFEYQPNSFTLFDPVKYIAIDGKQRSLFREHIYTADFIIKFKPSKYPQLAKEFKLSNYELNANSVSVYIDTKGTFNKTERAFNLNQKWVYQKFGIYVYKLIPKNFFKLFGCPKKCFYTAKKKQKRKMFLGYHSIKEMFSH